MVLVPLQLLLLLHVKREVLYSSSSSLSSVIQAYYAPVDAGPIPLCEQLSVIHSGNAFETHHAATAFVVPLTTGHGVGSCP